MKSSVKWGVLYPLLSHGRQENLCLSFPCSSLSAGVTAIAPQECTCLSFATTSAKWLWLKDAAPSAFLPVCCEGQMWPSSPCTKREITAHLINLAPKQEPNPALILKMPFEYWVRNGRTHSGDWQFAPVIKDMEGKWGDWDWTVKVVYLLGITSLPRGHTTYWSVQSYEKR